MNDERAGQTAGAPLTEGDLEAYLNGEAGERVTALINQSPELLAQVEVLRRMDEKLLRTFYGAGRPTAEELADYIAGTAPDAQRLRIAAYIRRHPDAEQELEAMRRIMQPAAGLIEVLRERAAMAMDAFLSAAQQSPLLAGTRGDGDLRQALYEVDTGTGSVAVSLHIYPATLPERFAISGQTHLEHRVPAADEDAAAPGEAWLLPEQNSEPLKTEVLMHGGFLFEEVRPGKYDLLLDLRPCSLRIQDIIV